MHWLRICSAGGPIGSSYGGSEIPFKSRARPSCDAGSYSNPETETRDFDEPPPTVLSYESVIKSAHALVLQ